MPFLAPLAIVGGIASAGMGVMSAVNTANATSASANYNAQVAAQNAQLAAWQRQQQEVQMSQERGIIATQGGVVAGRMEQQNRATLATGINNVGGAGVQITGSTEDSLKASALNNEKSVLDQEYKTSMSLYENETKANSMSYNSLIEQHKYQDESVLYKAEARNAQRTGFFNAVGAAIGGLSSAANSAYSIYGGKSSKTTDIGPFLPLPEGT